MFLHSKLTDSEVKACIFFKCLSNCLHVRYAFVHGIGPEVSCICTILAPNVKEFIQRDLQPSYRNLNIFSSDSKMASCHHPDIKLKTCTTNL